MADHRVGMSDAVFHGGIRTATVKICFRGEDCTFFVPYDLITKSSSYLKKRVDSETISPLNELATVRIDMADIYTHPQSDATLMSIMNAYIVWLHTGKIASKYSDEGFSDEHPDREYLFLLEIYKLGAFFGDCVFQDSVLDAFVSKNQTVPELFIDNKFASDVVEECWKSPTGPELSNLRKLLVIICIGDARPEDVRNEIKRGSQWSPDFITDVLQEVMAVPKDKVARKWTTCDFHFHPAGEHCAARRRAS